MTHPYQKSRYGPFCRRARRGRGVFVAVCASVLLLAGCTGAKAPIVQRCPAAAPTVPGCARCDGGEQIPTTFETIEDLERAYTAERIGRLQCAAKADACWRLAGVWSKAWRACGKG